MASSPIEPRLRAAWRALELALVALNEGRLDDAHGQAVVAAEILEPYAEVDPNG